MQPTDSTPTPENVPETTFEPTPTTETPTTIAPATEIAPTLAPSVITPTVTDAAAEVIVPDPSATPQPTETVLAAPVADAAPVVTGNLKRKVPILFVAIAAASLLLVGGVGAYFGVIIPNKPENLWKKGLTNTGKGYDRLVSYAETQKDTKGGKISGSFKVDTKEAVIDGTLDSKFYGKDSDTKIDAGAAGQRITLETLTHAADTSTNPDIYLRVNGLKGVDKLLGAGASGIGEQLAAFDNQWYFVDHTLLDQLEKSATKSDTSSLQDIKSQDVIDFAKAVGEPTKQYVFTDDESKSVLVVKQNVGKETVDGRGAYHFKVGINKEHLKAYNQALCDKALSTKIYKSTVGSGQSAADLKKQCEDTEGINSIKDTDTADVWVDTKTKLIRKVKFTDPKIAANFTELGLNYNGGDEYPFLVTANSDENGSKGKVTLSVTLNTKSNTAAIDLAFEDTTDGDTTKVTAKATIQPSNDKVEFKKPDGAKSFMELIGGFFGGSSEDVLGASTDLPFGLSL